MIVEIYGIDEADYRCAGCIFAKRLMKESSLDYTFYKMITRDESGNPKFDLDGIEVMMERANLPTARVSYPIIFIDDERIKVKDLQAFLYNKGYDVDPPT